MRHRRSFGVAGHHRLHVTRRQRMAVLAQHSGFEVLGVEGKATHRVRRVTRKATRHILLGHLSASRLREVFGRGP